MVEFDREDEFGYAKVARRSPGEGNTPDVIIATTEPDAARRLQLLRDREVDAALKFERTKNLDLIDSLALFDSTPNSTFRVRDDKVSSASRSTWWLGYHDGRVQHLFGGARHSIHLRRRAATYGQTLKRLQQNAPWLCLGNEVRRGSKYPTRWCVDP